MGCRFPGRETPATALAGVRDGSRDAITEVTEGAGTRRWRRRHPGKMATGHGGFLDRSTASTPASSASRRARRPAWTRSSGCCWRSPGRRWRTPACAATAGRQRDRRLRRHHAPTTTPPAASWRGTAQLDALSRHGQRRTASPRAGSSYMLGLAGAEPGGRHRLLLVAGRGPPGLPEPAPRRVPRWRWPAASTLILSPEASSAFSKAGMLAPDGRCKAFDAAADGFVRGEGCGVVVLKRLRDALADGDRILAVIRGSAVNQDGREQRADGAERAGAGGGDPPGAGAAPASMRRSVDYVEAHGTGTSLGDPIEVGGAGRRCWRAAPAAGAPLLIGSVKTNHRPPGSGGGRRRPDQGGAGAASTASCRAQLHFEMPSPHIRWEALQLRVADAARPVASQSKGVASRGSVRSASAGPTRMSCVAEARSRVRGHAGA